MNVYYIAWGRFWNVIKKAGVVNVGRRHYDRDSYEKLYDIIELIYILNRLSNNSYVDDRSKQYLIGMLNDVESIKNNFDKYRDEEPYLRKAKISRSDYDGYNYDNRDTFVQKIIIFLKSLNND